jgi:hypothetical protein
VRGALRARARNATSEAAALLIGPSHRRDVTPQIDDGDFDVASEQTGPSLAVQTQGSGVGGRDHHTAGTKERARRRTRGPVARRVGAWRCEILRRLAIDDRAGARRAVTAGLRVIAEYRTTLGASDLRAHRRERVASAQAVLGDGRSAPPNPGLRASIG